MKKALIILVTILFLVAPAAAWKHPTVTSKTSGELTSSQIVNTGQCYITSLTVITDGTNAATVILYNNTAASSTKIAEFVIAGGDRQGGRVWSFPALCDTGIYASISGTGASCIVEYIPN